MKEQYTKLQNIFMNSLLTCILVGAIFGLVATMVRSAKTTLKSEALIGDLKKKNQLLPSVADLTIPSSLIKNLPEAIEILQSNILPDEIVHRILDGNLGIYPAVFIATDKRVFRICKTHKKLIQLTYPVETTILNYSEISNIFKQKKMLLFFVSLLTNTGKDYKVEWLPDGPSIDLFISFVTGKINSSKEASVSNFNTNQYLRIGRNGEDLGNMPIQKVKMLLNSGHLELSDFYWDTQINEWIPLSSNVDII